MKKKLVKFLLFVWLMSLFQPTIYAGQGLKEKYSFKGTGNGEIPINKGAFAGTRDISVYEQFMVLVAAHKGEVTYQLKSLNEQIWWEINLVPGKHLKITSNVKQEKSINEINLWKVLENSANENKLQLSIKETVYADIDLSKKKMWEKAPSYDKDSATPCILIRRNPYGLVEFWLGVHPNSGAVLLKVCEYNGSLLNKMTFNWSNIDSGQIITVYDAN